MNEKCENKVALIYYNRVSKKIKVLFRKIELFIMRDESFKRFSPLVKEDITNLNGEIRILLSYRKTLE